MGEPRMPGTEWFPGAELNFAENLLRRRDGHPALIGTGEDREDEVVSYAELYRRVAHLQQGLQGLGVEAGDRVAALIQLRRDDRRHARHDGDRGDLLVNVA